MQATKQRDIDNESHSPLRASSTEAPIVQDRQTQPANEASKSFDFQFYLAGWLGAKGALVACGAYMDGPGQPRPQRPSTAALAPGRQPRALSRVRDAWSVWCADRGGQGYREGERLTC